MKGQTSKREAPARVWVLGAETMPHALIVTNHSTRAAYHYPEVGAVEYVRADLVGTWSGQQ